VILVAFPFSDLSSTKLRPAVSLAAAGRGDWVLCQITSNAYGDALAVPLTTTDFASGGLLVASVARPGKLFTAHESLIARSVGRLTDAAFQRVLAAVLDVLRSPPPPPASSPLPP
jgi:mRNA interferase MazF